MKMYLDIDETLNVKMPDRVWGRPRNHVFRGIDKHHRRLPVRWSPTLIAELRTLHVDLVWHTSWGHLAPERFGKVIEYGHESPFLCEKPKHWDGDDTMEWKVAALQKIEAADAYFIWVDNDLTPAQQALFPNALIVPVHPLRGILPADLEAIIEYQRHHRID